MSSDSSRFHISSESSRKEEEEDTSVSLDVLSDDLLEKTFSLLPISSIRNASLVSKRWHAVVQRPWAVIPPPRTALFFMFVDAISCPLKGLVYNPNLCRWSTARYPPTKEMCWDAVASSGLVCVMAGRDPRRLLFVCNPATGDRKQLPHGPLLNSTIPSTIAISVDRQTNSYTVAIVSRSKDTGDNCDVSVHVYESRTQMWVVAFTQSMPCFDHKSVICNGVLYCLVTVDPLKPEFCLLAYNLGTRRRSKSFVPTGVPAPPWLYKPLRLSLSPMLSNPWLMNLRDRVVMAGIIQDKDIPYRRADLGIWVLEKEGWCQVTQITLGQIRQRFGDRYYLIYCCGAGDFIYVYCWHSRLVLIFDMVKKKWVWSKKCPIRKRVARDPLLTGFCIESNFNINC